jgi:aminoglycoside phosphotransferase family enzyme/predicted kinase
MLVIVEDLVRPSRGVWPPRVAETHSAWVVFLGDRAYKIKKPVSLGFLDFTTRARREAALTNELELNRRLAPDVYLGVSDVLDSNGVPCEHVLVMRRMPDDRRLSALVARGVALDDDMRAIARVVAAFHAHAESSPEVAAEGAPARITAKLQRDLDEMDPYGPELFADDDLIEARRLALRYLEGRHPLLRARAARGCVRDGHGDLLADDIFCLPDGPRILDCIEFDARLRCCDVLADVAFLAMDLERLGATELAERFLAAYGELSGEAHPDSLAHYYVASRALVRSKVAAVRVDQGDPGAAPEANALLDLAIRHLRAAQVRLVLVGGAPGTGKSTVAGALAARLGWLVLRSDEVRKDVTGVGRATGSAADVDRGIYSSDVTGRTYSELLRRAELALGAGESVILDATWSDASWRRCAVRLADEAAADLVELRCDVASDIASARITRRVADGSDESDADALVARAIRSRFDAWPTARTLSTEAPVEDVVRCAADLVVSSS